MIKCKYCHAVQLGKRCIIVKCKCCSAVQLGCVSGAVNWFVVVQCNWLCRVKVWIHACVRCGVLYVLCYSARVVLWCSATGVHIHTCIYACMHVCMYSYAYYVRNKHFTFMTTHNFIPNDITPIPIIKITTVTNNTILPLPPLPMSPLIKSLCCMLQFFNFNDI
jgi:hypothetical protein